MKRLITILNNTGLSSDIIVLLMYLIAYTSFGSSLILFAFAYKIGGNDILPKLFSIDEDVFGNVLRGSISLIIAYLLYRIANTYHDKLRRIKSPKEIQKEMQTDYINYLKAENERLHELVNKNNKVAS